MLKRSYLNLFETSISHIHRYTHTHIYIYISIYLSLLLCSTHFPQRIEHENASTGWPRLGQDVSDVLDIFRCKESVQHVQQQPHGACACAKSSSSSWKSARPTAAERRRKLTIYIPFAWHIQLALPQAQLTMLTGPYRTTQHTQRLLDRFAKQGVQRTKFWGSSHRPSQPY